MAKSTTLNCSFQESDLLSLAILVCEHLLFQLVHAEPYQLLFERQRVIFIK
jgi:hypothetical protein